MSDRTDRLRKMDDEEVYDYLKMVRGLRDAYREKAAYMEVAVNEALLEKDYREFLAWKADEQNV
jgi:hypothetical protein